MGIVNVTPDSFYAGSRATDDYELSKIIRKLIDEGSDIIDAGGYSTRPGANEVSLNEEKDRIIRVLDAIRVIDENIPVSIDTFRSEIARLAVERYNVSIINDISGGRQDPALIDAVAELKIPYICMHSRGCPKTMNSLTDYSSQGGIVSSVIKEIEDLVYRLREAGINDLIIDPGFGFAKTIDQNYELLANIPLLKEVIQLPILVGLSRKSMLSMPLGINPDECLVPTVTAGTIALLSGVSILRVHDPLPHKQAIEIISKTYPSYIDSKND